MKTASGSDPGQDTARVLLWFGREQAALALARSALAPAQTTLRVLDTVEQLGGADRRGCIGVVVAAHACPGWRTLPARLRHAWPEAPPIIVLLDDEAAAEGRVPGADVHLLATAADWPERLRGVLRAAATPATTTAAEQAAPLPGFDTARPAVDLRGLRATFAELGADASEIEALVVTYLNELPAAFARLEHAVGAGELETAASAAHALKSPSATLGAAALAELLRRLEEMARSGDLSHARHLLELIRLESERVSDALARELGGGGA